ncbi:MULTISPECIES: proline dehydrogenase family protein [unclassified Micromonospora]|jgi:proline dehydrogenase|uniref:proline dehydrogenase family protein n=1 Tax=unclassified Micromonospora TaxID=2617518 RepID=UPI00103415A2|nr:MULTISPECIES: proline dehydrogenase family protein [unclassified Micromonospora]QKW16385.1 proline dehydrogenase family protein [Verrucosispora sp. NA02020]TBL31468.1 proline dehydrogenase [Verrucosispora sp. SN26_14.1]
MLRSVILAASRSTRVERLVATAPFSRDVVRRFVAGAGTDDALRVTRVLVDDGLAVTLDNLGEDTVTPEQANATRDEYLTLLRSLAGAGLTPAAEVSVKLSALGQAFDEHLAYDNARAICAAAVDAGTTVTLDMEDHTTTDSTLDVLADLRKDFPSTGAVLQAYLRRTESDCRELASAGSRVRLCKGAYKEPESVAYQSPREVDKSYVRCMNILMSGDGYPMLATHDPRLIAIGEDRARWFDRGPDRFEFQMLYGIRPEEQARLVGEGYAVRTYVPYGDDWYGYLMRRLAERPANLAFFARAVASRK